MPEVENHWRPTQKKGYHICHLHRVVSSSCSNAAALTPAIISQKVIVASMKKVGYAFPFTDTLEVGYTILLISH